MKNLAIVAVLVTAIPVAATDAPIIFVQISNLKTDTGEIRCALFRDPAGFPREPERAAARVVAKIEGRNATCLFSGMAAGRVAITAFHDENNNGKVDLRFGLIPKEGIGWSRNPQVSLRAPKFEEAVMPYDGGSTRVQITLNQR